MALGTRFKEVEAPEHQPQAAAKQSARTRHVGKPSTVNWVLVLRSNWQGLAHLHGSADSSTAWCRAVSCRMGLQSPAQTNEALFLKTKKDFYIISQYENFRACCGLPSDHVTFYTVNPSWWEWQSLCGLLTVKLQLHQPSLWLRLYYFSWWEAYGLRKTALASRAG